MTKKKKNSTPRLRVDDSETGCVMPCPLCEQRFWTPEPLAAWKALYRHLRKHHNSQHAAELTQKARHRIQRMNWDIAHGRK